MAAAAATVTLANVEERPYQSAIAEAVLGRNSLIVLPTGLGKTIICARVMAHHIAAGERVLVLAPTRPLVEQHAKTFRTHIPGVEVTVLTGAEPREKRGALWGTGDVVVATPQVARNDILSRTLAPEGWGLLVVDEAHRAVGNYAAVDVAHALRVGGSRVLGATASPGSTPARIGAVTRALGIEHVEARGEWDDDVRDHVQPVAVEWVHVTLPKTLELAAVGLRKCAEKKVGELRQMGLYASRFINRRELLESKQRLQRRLGNAADARTSRALGLIARAMRLLHGVQLIETQSVTAARVYLEELGVEDRDLSSDPAVVEALSRLNQFGGEHPKMRRCAAELERRIAPDAMGKAIVFVQYRETARALAAALGRVPGLRVGLFVGQSGPDGLNQREQVEMLSALSEGRHNVLVATSVGEEGLDVPNVDLVVFYEPVSSAIRSIQRRGRTGRHSEGRVLFLMARQTADEAAYWTSVRKERQMRSLVRTLRELPKAGQASATIIRPNPVEVAPGSDGSLRVLVDHRELNGPLARLLVQSGIETEPSNLPVGDIVVSSRLVVERKSAHDFVLSLLDGRLMEQARGLKRSFEAPVLIVEGDPFEHAGGVRPEAIAGALAALSASFGITVLTVRDVQQTARLVGAMARREHEERAGPPAIRQGSPGRTLEERQRFLVEGLPLVSGTLGTRLLDHFGSPAAVFAAPEDELRRVRGIGPTTARAIHEVVHASFETPWHAESSASTRARDPTTRSGTGAAKSDPSRSLATTC